MTKTQKANHTLGPWTIQERDPGEYSIVDGDGVDLAIVMNWGDGIANKEVKANASFIIRAVNSHEGLVMALRDMINDLENNGEIYGTDDKRIAHMEAALKSAEEEI